MLRLLFCSTLLVFSAGAAQANDGVPYSEHGDVTGQETAVAPHEIEPAAGEAIEDDSEGVPYSEHGDVTGQETAVAPHEIEPAAGEAIEDDSEGVPYSEHGDVTE